MSSILATTLFAASAAAQLTTSIWLPGAGNSNISFVASVIEQSGDRTTLSLDFADPTASEDDYYGEAPATVTVGGETYAAYQATASDLFGEDDTTVTISLACERSDTSAVPTCTASSKGFESVISALCSSAATESHVTPMEYDAYCTETDFTTETTMTLSGDSQYYINQFPLIITAGTEKLGASAAATPTSSGARSTGSGSASPASGSASGSPASTGAGSASAASSGAVNEQSTAAAPPMKTMVPALAGLGAAAAAFFL
jgi:hypothetical protein